MNIEGLLSNKNRKRLQSPDRVDTLLPITTSLSWVALVAVALLVLAALVWSVFGMIIIKVPGQGIILDYGGVSQVSAGSSGTVVKLMVTPGMKVKKGDLLAVIKSPDTEASRLSIKSELETTENMHDMIASLSQYDSQNFRGILTQEIRASNNGKIDEISVQEGDIVSTGTAICMLHRSELPPIYGENISSGVIYVAAQDSRKITPGMVLQLTPSGTDSSLDGSLMAEVTNVSQYPVSEDMVIHRTKNRNLTQSIMQYTNNSCVEVSFELIKDQKDTSGYLWTSKNGKHMKVTPGCTVQGFAVVDRIPPLEKVFLKFSDLVRNR